MASVDDDFFSSWNGEMIWSRRDLPLTLQSQVVDRSNSVSTTGSPEEIGDVKSLLCMDETILQNLNVDEVSEYEVESKCEEYDEVMNESWFDKDSNKSRFFVDDLSQRNYDDLGWESADDEFEKCNSNSNIIDDMNRSLNLLREKLIPSGKDVVIPRKRRHIDTKKNEVISTSFYGLPDEAKHLIKKHKGIDKLYDWQEECLSMKAIDQRKNLIYALPTSGGKTLVAEILMLKEILCRKKNAIFILPFVALVQEKIQSMTPFALELGFLIEEYAAEKGPYPPKKRRKKNSLYVCTIEKSQALINCLIELDRLDEIGIIVVDELHLLGEDGGRGATLECLLTKVIFSECNIQIIGMSATIGNLSEIASFLDAETYVQNFRPIHIKEYVKCGNEKWLIDSKQENMFIEKETINYEVEAKLLQYTKESREKDTDFLGYLVMEVVPKDSCLVFCPTKKRCENVALLLVDVLQGKKAELENHKAEEKLALLNALRTETGQICQVLKKTIKFGFAYHHSGLTAEERRLLEEAFKSGVLSVICCTSTLAAGVNLPARRVILRSPHVGNQFLNISRYKQMIGRAGRTGLGEIGESILICSKTEMEQVQALLSSKMDDSVSSLHQEKDRGINNLVISSVLLSLASTRADIHKVVSKTLLKVQEKRLGISAKQVTDQALATLIRSGILRKKSEDTIKPCPELDTTVIFPTQIERNDDEEEMKEPAKKKKNVVKLTDSTELEICPLGKAAMKGSMDLQTAYKLYKDIKVAQQSLITEDNFHLLYLITPYDIASQVKLDGVVFHDAVLSLPAHQMKVAQLLGINEAVAGKIRNHMRTSVSATVVQRFYVTLMLHELWRRRPIHIVAEKYKVDRGAIQNLLASASSFSSSATRFCQELEEFWVYRNLFSEFGQKITYCCAAELEPLMGLPFVKTGRAMQLYKAGYKSLQSVATAVPEEMVNKIKHLSKRVVYQIISAAKKAENLRDEYEEVLEGLERI